jgi:hypothetical protein
MSKYRVDDITQDHDTTSLYLDGFDNQSPLMRPPGKEWTQVKAKEFQSIEELISE